jgi:YD repeat-containing protein
MSIRTCLRTLACLAAVLFVETAFAEEIRDYYAEPGINPFKETRNDNFNEHIDPFSGTLQLQYTDVHVPGNGGLDVKVTRTYTSLQTNDYPKIGRNGLGWTMHFGRIVASSQSQANICNQGAFPLTTKENPSLELPDGGREILVLSRYHTDGTLVTRSNWRAQCTTGIGMMVTAPNGTRYTMDRFDFVEEEPSWLTTRIEDVHGNWIAIDYATNSVGISYITQIRRSEDGVVVTFEYEDLNTPGIVISAIHSNNQTWRYEYQTIPGFMFSFYKQLVRVARPDGTSWNYTYNPKMGDPDPNDDVLEDGIASYSLIRAVYPHGAQIDYTYQYVQFDPGAAPTFRRTTAIATKHVSGSGVTSGTWTYTFTPFSEPFTDVNGRQARYDVTTVTAPEAIYRYTHLGKDFNSTTGTLHFIRPSYVGTQMSMETWSRELSSRLIERRVKSWTLRKISEEDFWHGSGYRDWWRDDGTYATVLTGEFVTRDARTGDSQARHARRFSDHDIYGNPGVVVDHVNVGGVPSKQVRYTYFNDTAKWIIGLPLDETHEALEGNDEETLGTVEREYDANGLLRRIVDFGEETLYTYTGEGDVKTVRDPRGNTTRFDDYKRGIARLEERPESVTLHRVVNDNGTLRSETNGRGFITRFTYDDLHRLTAIDYPIAADVSIRYENGFGVERRVLTRGNYRQTEAMNDFGEILRMEREDLGSAQSVVRTAEYDAQHRKLFESYPNSSIGTRSVYDALGRVLRITHPDNSFIAYEYNDDEVTVRNERNFPTRYLYMVPGIDFDGQEPVAIYEPEKVTTLIHRDVWANAVQVFQGELRTDGLVYGFGKSYRYDDRRLLVEAVEPEVGKTVFGHDEVGNVISERVNNLPAVTYQYDALNRRTRADFADATPDVVTEYDENGNPERVTKGTTQWVYTYDGNDNLRTETLTVNHPLFAPRVFALAHEYSNLDVLSQTTYPSGLVVAYEPDAFGRATQVGTFASNVTYHSSGQVQSYTLANGVITNVALNQRLLTQSITAPGVVNLTYGYDTTGNVLQISDGIDSTKNVVMNNGSYDGLSRLLNGNGKWGAASFTYDHNGNIRNRNIGQRGLKFSTDSSQRVRQVQRFAPATPNTLTGVTLYDYDKRGNARSKRQYNFSGSAVGSIDDRQFEFDAASQLTRARVTQTTTAGETLIANKEYVYDGNGQRVLEQKHGTYDIRFSVYGLGGQLVFEDSISECTRTDYVRLGALNIARSDDRPPAASLDTDGDGMRDCMETQLGLDPNTPADAAADADSDGVSNLDEFRAGTSLVQSDTDNDGRSDHTELTLDLTDASSGDTDGDGLSDSEEASNPALDAKSSDRDHDGVSDYWEVQLTTNPNDGSDALLDSDADGYSNRQESQAKSDPQAASTTPTRGAELWSNDSLSAYSGDVAIGRDRSLYVTGDDGKVRAFYPDGRKRWVVEIPFSSVYAPTVGPDGTIYVVSQLRGGVQVGSPRSFVYAFNPDGTERWESATTDFLETAAAVGQGNRLYIGGFRFNEFSGASSGLMVALDASTGARVLTRTIVSTPDVAPTVSFAGNVFVGTYEGTFHAFTETLTPLWEYSMRGRIASSASIADDGTVYAGDYAGYVYSWTPTGTLRWEQQFSPQGPQYSSVTIADEGVLYIGGYESRLLAVNALDGSTRWTVPTTGTTFTPAVAANGTVYATTYGGDLMAFAPADGARLWRVDSGTNVNAPPVVDRDGTIYFGTMLGQLYAVADNAGGPARSPWPMRRHDSAATSYTCFNEPAFSVSADGDGDRIDDCAELRYGLDPANAADGATDSDNDGLLNWEEHELGTRLDLADTDSDGLNDGLEVRTYNTNPKLADSDHDTIADGVEVQIGTNPLDDSDADIDTDGDGFSNRQESWAGTDLLNASSRPATGQVLRQETGSFSQKNIAVGRDGTIYQNSENGLEALNPDFTPKWNWPTPIIGSPVIGRDGTIYVATARASQQQRLVALLPNGAVRWSVTFQSSSSQFGLYDSPVLGPNGVVYIMETGTHSQGDLLHAFDGNGVHLAEWGGGPSRVFARKPAIAVAANGDIVAFDSSNALSMRRANNGTQIWRVTDSSTIGGGTAGVVIGPNGTIYLVKNSSLTAVNPANGARLWASPASGYPLIDGNNRLIVYCTFLSNLCALDPATGAVVWTDTNDFNYVGAPVIDAEGSILALTSNSMFVALNADGSPRWQTPVTVSSGANGPVVLGDGTIYVGASGARLLLAGSGRGLDDSHWPARNRDQKNSRSATDVSDVEPSQSPQLSITSPAAQSIRVDAGQAINATAVASDFQDGSLNTAIQWTSSLSGPVGTGPQLSLGNLVVGMHTLTASVTDSDGNSASATRTIEVGVFPPELTIYEPYEGYTYDQGQAVGFYATAQDVMDGDISANVRWSSSRDGELGVGQSFTRTNLSVGAHVITARSIDSTGVETTRTVNIVVQSVPPTIEINSPSEMQEIEFGLPTNFYGWANDGVDGDLSDNINWSSNLEGALGVGRELAVSNLRLGTHVITATVTDSSGSTTSATRNVVVRHLPPDLSVYSPWYYSEVPHGDPVQFEASAQDLVDGDLTAAIQWSSTLEGSLGTGGFFERSDLSVGMHLVTASVADSHGQTRSEQRYVVVQSETNTAPFVSISAPAAGAQVYLTDPVTMTATAFDTQDGLISANVQWSSSINGPLGTGASLTVSTLSVGTHTLRAFVQDSTNGKGAATVQITVLPIPPDYPPTIRFTSIGVGARYTSHSAFAISAVASDRENGDISSRLTWSSNLDGPLGTGDTVFVSGLSAGVHDITARVVDDYGNVVTATRTVEVFADGDAMLLNEEFAVIVGPDALAGWQKFDDGTSFPSAWVLTGGALAEFGNAQAGATGAAAIEKPGTYMRQTTGAYWLDYRLQARLRSTDNDGLGLMFRYVDNNNYYRFSMDSERSFRRLVKKANGVYTLLWQDSVPYVVNQNYEVAITAEGSSITLAIDGVQLWSGTDASHRRGTIALYAWSESAAYFDNVRVTNLRTVESNDPPQITIATPANNSSFFVGNVVPLSGTALDFEDGNLAPNVSWTSSLDGGLGTGATLNVSTLQIGAHVITASVTDSDGVTSTATVNITVEPPFNEPPTVNVTAPANGATFNVGANVSFAGTANDVEDGNVSHAIAWTSSRNGLLGTGASLSVSTLSPGSHTITASITDSGGKTATVTRTITVVVPGNTAPVVTLSAPLNGSAFEVGQTIALSATATDAQDGSLTGAIAWSSSISGALGTGGSLNVSTLSAGVHAITARAEDSMGGSHSLTANVTIVPTAGILLRDDFSDNEFSGWTVTDEGTISAPSAWSAATGALRQTSDIHSSPTTAATIPKPGTFARWTAGTAWTNYSITAELNSSDNDVLGVMFRYTNNNNYYRFSMDSERANRRLSKKRNGTWTTLWSDTTAYQLNRTYVLEIIANGSSLTVKLDGVQLWTGNDTQTLTTGTVAMYSWQNTGARFDNVLVRNLSVPLANTVRPPAPRLPIPEREPIRLVMVLPRLDAYRAFGAGSLQ